VVERAPRQKKPRLDKKDVISTARRIIVTRPVGTLRRLRGTDHDRVRWVLQGHFEIAGAIKPEIR
jgi:hypothetical protein